MLSAVGCRLAAVGCRLTAVGSRLSALGSRLSALARLSALGSRLSALGSRLLRRVFCKTSRFQNPHFRGILIILGTQCADAGGTHGGSDCAICCRRRVAWCSAVHTHNLAECHAPPRQFLVSFCRCPAAPLYRGKQKTTVSAKNWCDTALTQQNFDKNVTEKCF